MKPTQGFLLFLGGILIGGAAALLFAPEKGEKTRRDIKRFFEEEKDRLMDAASDLRDELVEGGQKAEQAIKRAVKKQTAAL